MSTPYDYRGYFLLDDVTFVYIDGAGVIQTTTDINVGLANPLRAMPTNWEEIEIEWARSESLHGIFIQTSGTYTFVQDAAKILRSFIITQGYTATLKFRVDVCDKSTYTYDTYIISDISFELPEISAPDYNVKAVMFENGLGQDIKTNLDTPYEISFDGGIQVYFAGTRVIGAYNYRYGASMTRLAWPTARGINNGWYFNTLISFINNEGFSPVVEAKTIFPFEMGQYSSLLFLGDTENTQYGFANKDTQPLELRIQQEGVQMEWTYRDSGGAPTVDALFEMFVIVAEPNVPYAIYPFYSGIITSALDGVPNLEVVPDFNNVYPNLLQSQNIYIVSGIFVTSTSPIPNGSFEVRNVTPDESKTKITVKFNTSPSLVDSMRQPVMWDKVVKAVADGNYGATPVASTFLNDPNNRIVDNYPYHTMFTNGLAIKGVSGSFFKITLGDLIKHFQALYPVGVGVLDNVAFLEHLNYFYDDSVTLGDLGELTDVVITPMNKMAKVLEFGYEYEKTLDVLNGRDDWNTVTKYKTAGRFNSDKKLSFVSSAVASIYEIEQARVDDAGKTTTGDKINDQLFCFVCYLYQPIGQPPFLEYPNQLGGIVTGVNFPDWAYNVAISPAHMRSMQEPLLNSYCYPSTFEIVYQTSDRSGTMVSKFLKTLTPTTYYPEIAENENFTPDADPILFLPFNVDAKCVVPFDIKGLMHPNPFGAFDATIKGNPVRVFIDNIKNRPSKRNIFDIKCRFAPSTDLTPIINA